MTMWYYYEIVLKLLLQTFDLMIIHQQKIGHVIDALNLISFRIPLACNKRIHHILFSTRIGRFSKMNLSPSFCSSLIYVLSFHHVTKCASVSILVRRIVNAMDKQTDNILCYFFFGIRNAAQTQIKQQQQQQNNQTENSWKCVVQVSMCVHIPWKYNKNLWHENCMECFFVVVPWLLLLLKVWYCMRHYALVQVFVLFVWKCKQYIWTQ